MVPSEKLGGNGHTLKHKRLSVSIRKQCFIVRVTEHWHRLLTAVVKSLSLEILKSHLHMILGSLD